MVIFVGKFFGNMVISITTHWSFRLYGPFLAGPDVDHISGIDCTKNPSKFMDTEKGNPWATPVTTCRLQCRPKMMAVTSAVDSHKFEALQRSRKWQRSRISLLSLPFVHPTFPRATYFLRQGRRSKRVDSRLRCRRHRQHASEEICSSPHKTITRAR